MAPARLARGLLAVGVLLSVTASCGPRRGSAVVGTGQGQPPAASPGSGPSSKTGSPRPSPSDWRRQVAASLPEVPAESVRVLDELACDDILPEGCRLFVGGISGLGDASLMERLCFRSSTTSSMVRGPEDLRGSVVIRSPAGAVTFVRLFTSPATVKCLPEPWWVEVAPLSEVDRGLLLGRRRRPQWLGGLDASSGSFGVLSQADWRKSRLRPATVLRGRGVFVVRRPLIKAKATSYRTRTVLQVRETVWPDGRLDRRVEQRRWVWAPTLEVPVAPM